MKRKAEQAELQMLQNSHWTKSMRTEPEFPSYDRPKSPQLIDNYRTPAKPIPVLASTPFSTSPSAPSSDVNANVMGGAEAELRRVVDNFVSIYEQLDKCEGSDVKPNYSYTELAYLAMLRSPNFCLPITEIYRYIQSRFLFFKNSTRKHWKNAVRHSLAKTMCFSKIAIGRGISNSENLSRSTYLWCIVPNSIVSFARGDYRPSVDKESGTNTLRWGYMRVNAGQFWDQVGNYIATKMTSFRKFLQESPHPGQIFEQQVCWTPDHNPSFPHTTTNNGQTAFGFPPRDTRGEQFDCHGYSQAPQYVYGLSRLLEGQVTRTEPVLAVPAQGYNTSPPYCDYANSSMSGGANSLNHRFNHGLNPRFSNMPYLTNTRARNTTSDRLTTPLQLSSPNRLTPAHGLTPPIRSTPPHTMFDINDSGFESCGSSPDIETGSSCRPPNNQQHASQYLEKFSVGSCDFLEADLPLEFSFNDPDLSSFCDNLLSTSIDLKSEPVDVDVFDDLADQSFFKENVQTTSWYSDARGSPIFAEKPTDSTEQQQQPQMFRNHGDCRFSGSQSEPSVSMNDPMELGWQLQKSWY